MSFRYVDPFFELPAGAFEYEEADPNVEWDWVTEEGEWTELADQWEHQEEIATTSNQDRPDFPYPTVTDLKASLCSLYPNECMLERNLTTLNGSDVLNLTNITNIFPFQNQTAYVIDNGTVVSKWPLVKAADQGGVTLSLLSLLMAVAGLHGIATSAEDPDERKKSRPKKEKLEKAADTEEPSKKPPADARSKHEKGESSSRTKIAEDASRPTDPKPNKEDKGSPAVKPTRSTPPTQEREEPKPKPRSTGKPSAKNAEKSTHKPAENPQKHIPKEAPKPNKKSKPSVEPKPTSQNPSSSKRPERPKTTDKSNAPPPQTRDTAKPPKAERNDRPQPSAGPASGPKSGSENAAKPGTKEPPESDATAKSGEQSSARPVVPPVGDIRSSGNASRPQPASDTPRRPQASHEARQKPPNDNLSATPEQVSDYGKSQRDRHPSQQDEKPGQKGPEEPEIQAGKKSSVAGTKDEDGKPPKSQEPGRESSRSRSDQLNDSSLAEGSELRGGQAPTRSGEKASRMPETSQSNTAGIRPASPHENPQEPAATERAAHTGRKDAKGSSKEISSPRQTDVQNGEQASIGRQSATSDPPHPQTKNGTPAEDEKLSPERKQRTRRLGFASTQDEAAIQEEAPRGNKSWSGSLDVVSLVPYALGILLLLPLIVILSCSRSGTSSRHRPSRRPRSSSRASAGVRSWFARVAPPRQSPKTTATVAARTGIPSATGSGSSGVAANGRGGTWSKSSWRQAGFVSLPKIGFPSFSLPSFNGWSEVILALLVVVSPLVVDHLRGWPVRTPTSSPAYHTPESHTIGLVLFAIVSLLIAGPGDDEAPGEAEDSGLASGGLSDMVRLVMQYVPLILLAGGVYHFGMR